MDQQGGGICVLCVAKSLKRLSVLSFRFLEQLMVSFVRDTFRNLTFEFTYCGIY